MACFFVVLWISNFHADVLAPLALAYTLITSLKILIRELTYWEFDSLCFRERRFWRMVTCVSSVPQGRSLPGYLTIGCDYRAPMASQGGIAANPEDRDRFLAALHQFAPHVKFEI